MANMERWMLCVIIGFANTSVKMFSQTRWFSFSVRFFFRGAREGKGVIVVFYVSCGIKYYCSFYFFFVDIPAFICHFGSFQHFISICCFENWNRKIGKAPIIETHTLRCRFAFSKCKQSIHICTIFRVENFMYTSNTTVRFVAPRNRFLWTHAKSFCN